jgi:hypothetical protein
MINYPIQSIIRYLRANDNPICASSLSSLPYGRLAFGGSTLINFSHIGALSSSGFSTFFTGCSEKILDFVIVNSRLRPQCTPHSNEDWRIVTSMTGPKDRRRHAHRIVAVPFGAHLRTVADIAIFDAVVVEVIRIILHGDISLAFSIDEQHSIRNDNACQVE